MRMIIRMMDETLSHSGDQIQFFPGFYACFTFSFSDTGNEIQQKGEKKSMSRLHFMYVLFEEKSQNNAKVFPLSELAHSR